MKRFCAGLFLGLVFLLSARSSSMALPYQIMTASVAVIDPAGADLKTTTLKFEDKIRISIEVKEHDGSGYNIPAASGTAWANIGNVLEGITLFDDGLTSTSTHSDNTAGDGIYSTILSIPAGITVSAGEIKTYFTSSGTVSAENDGYPFGVDTSTSNDISITIDATRPVVTNVGLLTLPYNPEKGYLNISYTLNEGSVIQIEIYRSSYTPANLIRKLTPPPAMFGDNFVTWDGLDDEGYMVGTLLNGVINDSGLNGNPDGDYKCVIKATDLIGNRGEDLITTIKVSTVFLEVYDMTVSPNPVTPDDDNVNDNPNFNLKMLLRGSTLQLNNLDFDVEASSSPYNRPYALLALNMYSSAGERIDTLEQDLTDGDSDPFPNDWPNYVSTVPSPYLWYPFSFPLAGSAGLPIWADGDGADGNDWDILVPFDRVSGTTDEYEAIFSVRHIFKSPPDNGTYIERAQFELVAADWVVEIEEKTYTVQVGSWTYSYENFPFQVCHEKPDYTHFSPLSNTVEQVFIVEDSLADALDFTAPTIVFTDPGQDEQKQQGKVDKVFAYLNDGLGGIGVDLVNSVIYLKNPLGNKVSGTQTNDGANKIYWKLPENTYLDESGVYTIVVEAVDKRGNTTGEVECTFTVIDTLPPYVVSTKPEENILKNGSFSMGSADIAEFTIILFDEGVGLDGARTKPTMTLEKDEAVVASSTTWVSSPNSDSFTLTPNSLPIAAGNYELKITAYDKSGNAKAFSYLFTVSGVGAVYVSYGGLTYMTLPAGTTIYSGGVSTESVSVKSPLPVLTNWDEAHFGSVGDVIDFEPDSLSFSKTVTLTMHYTDEDIASVSDENDLLIYGYSAADGWSSLSGTVVDAANNRINLQINSGTTLAERYIVGYILPPRVSSFTEMVKAYPQPSKKGSITFAYDKALFSGEVTEQVEIYTIYGEKLWERTQKSNPASGAITWNYKSNYSALAPGVYIYRLTVWDATKSYEAVKKAVIYK
ncbi:MAG: hypothetical protein ABIJ15_05825 [bacterium]